MSTETLRGRDDVCTRCGKSKDFHWRRLANDKLFCNGDFQTVAEFVAAPLPASEPRTPVLRCDECGILSFDMEQLAEIHSCGRRGVFRLTHVEDLPRFPEPVAAPLPSETRTHADIYGGVEETPQRCDVRQPETGYRCGDYAGHDGDHTVLIANAFLRPKAASSPSGSASDSDDAQNIASLIVVCEELKKRLVPWGASAGGYDSAIATLNRLADTRAESQETDVLTDFEDDITCPKCGTVDYEHCDYPTFRPNDRDGDTARWTCPNINCGADCVVTLCVTYTYSAALLHITKAI